MKKINKYLSGIEGVAAKNAGTSGASSIGNVMGGYGNLIGNVGGTIATLIHANKKQDPTGRPYKTGTKNLNSMKKNKNLIKYQEGVISTKPSFENFIAGDIRRTSTGLPATSIYGTTAPSSRKTVVRQKPAMTAEMQRVARLQQKMRDAGYNIKVDGIWKKGGETERAYQGYIKDKAADASRRGTVNTGQGPTIQNAENLREARALGARGSVLDQVTVTAPARKTYNPLDSSVLRGAAADTQERMNREQAAIKAKRKAREAEIARNSQSLPSASSSNRFTFNAADKGQGTDVTAIQNEALKRNRLVGDGATSKGSSRIQYADGAKKVSAYKKLDTKLGGILPGGVTRAEARAIKEAKKNPVDSLVDYSSSLGRSPSFKPEAVKKAMEKEYGGPVSTEKNPILYKEEPATSSTKPLLQKYQENKGGYARALKSGKRDAQGNAVDPNTGLTYKILPSTKKTKTSKTSEPTESSLFKQGKAIRNFTDKTTNRVYYTNGRVFDIKTGKKGNYLHNPNTKQITTTWDKAKAAPKRKGDDTYMDEIIDFSSRAIGSLGGAALAGGSTFGVGSVAGGIAGDRAGKAFGNWLNKKLGYREEDDTSQEGYSLGEAAFGALGGVGGRLVKPVGAALIKYAGKEGAKIAAAPLGRAVAATGKAAGKLVGRGGSKTAQAAGQTAAQTSGKAASQVASKTVNAPGAVSKVVPTRQSSLAVGNTGKIPTKAVRGERGRFTKNPSRKPVDTTPGSSKMVPERPARFNPDYVKIRPNGPTAMDKIGRTPGTTSAASSQAAASTTGKAAQNTAKTAVSKTKAAARLAKQKGKKLITYAKNNKKKVAIGAAGAGTLLGGGYAASQIRTGE